VPEARFCPTGGVTPENMVDYLALSNVPIEGVAGGAPQRGRRI
jgi:2-keto-3-deoxy-6-phosphogluconate aldolase